MARKKEVDPFRAIALDGIERHAWWIKHSGDQCAYYVKMMASRPDFETRAEEAMELAEKMLTGSLKQIKETRDLFAKLKKDGSE